MKTLNKMIILVSGLLSKPFYFFASLSSLVGFAIVFMNDTNKVLWSFIFFNVLLLALIGTLIYTILKILNSSGEEFDSKSTFMKYETLDGNKYTFEVFKLIQCKRPVLSEYDFSFKWSGTHLPIVTSNLQEVRDVIDLKTNSNYDKAVLRFKNPLRYNESCMVHFKAEIDDSDKKSDTHLSNRIIRQVDVIHYRIVLKDKVKRPNAFLERKKIDAVTQSFESIQEIPFDKLSKSYEHHLLNPELGFIYRIRWDR